MNVNNKYEAYEAYKGFFENIFIKAQIFPSFFETFCKRFNRFNKINLRYSNVKINKIELNKTILKNILNNPNSNIKEILSFYVKVSIFT